jgi:hypothetical protein
VVFVVFVFQQLLFYGAPNTAALRVGASSQRISVAEVR